MKYITFYKLALICLSWSMLTCCSSSFHLKKAIKKGWKPKTTEVPVFINDSTTIFIPCPDIALPKTRQEVRQQNKTDRKETKQTEKTKRTELRQETKQEKSENKKEANQTKAIEKAAVKNNRIDSRENVKLDGCGFWQRFRDFSFGFLVAIILIVITWFIFKLKSKI